MSLCCIEIGGKLHLMKVQSAILIQHISCENPTNCVSQSSSCPFSVYAQKNSYTVLALLMGNSGSDRAVKNSSQSTHSLMNMEGRGVIWLAFARLMDCYFNHSLILNSFQLSVFVCVSCTGEPIGSYWGLKVTVCFGVAFYFGFRQIWDDRFLF